MEAGYLRFRYVVEKTVSVIEFEVNVGGVSGTNCSSAIEVRTGAAKLSNAIVTRCGEGRNLNKVCTLFSFKYSLTCLV